MLKNLRNTMGELFGINKAESTSNSYMSSNGLPKVYFYQEAAYHGDHGTIVVNHRAFRLTDRPVRFAFAGMSNPPKMTPSIAQYIWDQALEQGFLPQFIERYNQTIMVAAPAEVN